MFGKKNRLGFNSKVRSLEEINRDYNHHAAQAGHKGRIILQLQEEIDQHLENLVAINAEASQLPKEAPTPAPSETTQPEPPEAA